MGLSTKGAITPYEGSWAHQQELDNQARKAESNWPIGGMAAMIEARKKRLASSIESAKRCPVIFQNENIAWYMRLFHCSREEARQELGYPKPLFTMTLEEYRKSPLRFG